MLWVYAKNDSYFNPILANAMYQAFTGAGGKADLVSPRAYDEDGHHLFFGHDGSAVWGPIVDEFMKTAGSATIE